MSKRTSTSFGERIACRSLIFALVMFVVSGTTWADDRFAEPEGDDKQREPKWVEEQARFGIGCPFPKGPLQLAEEMAQSRDDAWCLEGSLALLHDDWHRGTSVDALLRSLEYLVGHTWRVLPEETPEAMLARIQREFKADRHATVKMYRRAVERDKKLSDDTWPYGWQAKKELWLLLVATMVRSYDAEDPAALWRTKMAEDPTHQRLYRYCYIAFARKRRVAELDFDLVKPMLEKHQTNSLVDLAWQARVLHTYAAARVRVDHPERVAVRKLFLNNLRTFKLSPFERTYGHHLSRAIDKLYDACDRSLERPQMLNAIADAGLKELQFFLRGVAVSDSEKRNLLLARKTTVDFHNTPVAIAIQFLEQETLLTIVVDEAVWESVDRVTIQMSGTWLDVTEALLEKTKYTFEPLGRSMLWIGRPERATRLREMLIRGQKKAVFASEKVITALSEKTNIEFIETPVIDVADYLEDLHGITIEVFGDIGRKPISKDIKGVPLHLALELICADAKFNWGTIDEIVVFAPDEEMKKLNALKRDRLRRWSRSREDGKLAEALRESTNIEFIETPLFDVVNCLSDLHAVPIRLTDAEFGLRPITADLKGMSLDFALDLMMLQNNLAWYTDGKEVVLGSENAIKELREKRLMD